MALPDSDYAKGIAALSRQSARALVGLTDLAFDAIDALLDRLFPL